MPQPRSTPKRPAPRSTQAAPDKAVAAGGAGAAAGAAATAALAATAPVAPLTAAGLGVGISAQVLQASGRVLGAIDALFRRRRRELPVYVRSIVQEEMPSVEPSRMDQLAHEEVRREVEFQRRARLRMAAELPLALAETDAGERAARVRALVEREKRYLQQRAEASASRVVAALEADLLKGLSPDGAYWRMSPLVREHTLDCIAMADKFWPWQVLEHVHPQLHAGCQCRLLSKSEAVAERLMNPDDVPEQGAVPPEVHETWVRDAVVVAQAILSESTRLQEQLTTEELDDAILEFEAVRLQEAAERWASGTTKGGQFKPKRGGTPGAPALGRSRRAVRGLRDTADRLKPTRGKVDEPKAHHKAQDPVPVDAGDGYTSKHVQDLKPGDSVMVNGKPDEVVEIRDADTGVVMLKDTGLAMIDPKRPVRVKTAEPAPAPAPPTGGPDKREWYEGLEAFKADVERERTEHPEAHYVWNRPVLKTFAALVDRMPVGQTVQLNEGMTLRRAEHGWVLSQDGWIVPKTDSLNVSGQIYMRERSREAGYRYTGSSALTKLDPALIREYEDAKLEHEYDTRRRLEQGHKTPEERTRFQFDWKASAEALGLTVADLDAGPERQRELIEIERASYAAEREVQKRIYRELLRNTDAFEVVDHSDRLGSKPFEVRPRPDTVGALGGDSFLRENGANLRLSRFKTRENAQAAVDKLNKRELARLDEELGPDKTPEVKPPKPPEPDPDVDTEGSTTPTFDQLGDAVTAGREAMTRVTTRQDWGDGPRKLADYRTHEGTRDQRAVLDEMMGAITTISGLHRDMGEYESKDYMRERRSAEALAKAEERVEANITRVEGDEQLPFPVKVAAMEELLRFQAALRGERSTQPDPRPPEPEPDGDTTGTGGDHEESNGIDTPPEPPEPTPPTGADEDAPKPTYDAVASLLARGAPDAAGTLVPGFFDYTGERGQIHEDENGVMQLQWYFFRQSKDRRTRVAFTHLGNRLARDGDRDEKPTARMYAGLAGGNWQELTLTKPDEAADVATLAREHGYPLRSEVSDWLADREGPAEAAELTRARGLLANTQGKAFAETNSLLTEAGYVHSGAGDPDTDGRRTQIARNFTDGYELRYSFNPAKDYWDERASGEGEVVAYDSPPPSTAPTVGQSMSEYFASANSPEATGATMNTVYGSDGLWEQVVNGDGEGFAFIADSTGTVTAVRAFTPTEREAGEARKWAIKRKPERFITGQSWHDAETTMEGAGFKHAMLQGYSAGDQVTGYDAMGGATTVTARPGEGIKYVREFRDPASGRQVLVHMDDQGVVVKAGRPAPGGHTENGVPAPWAIASTDAEWNAWQAAAAAAKQAELDRRDQARRDREDLAFSGLTQAMAAGRKGKVKDEALKELFSTGALTDGNALVSAMVKGGWGLRARRNSRVDGQRNITYTLRGPDGSTVKIRTVSSYTDRSVKQVELLPNKQTSRERLAKGRVWKNKDELYQDALGRADELAARHGGVSFVTTIIDNEGSGRYAQAHHEWNGAIVMSKSSGFQKRFSSYLKRRKDGDHLTDRDHLDFYDAMSTLQHEVNHGVGKAGDNEGGLAFGSRHYRKTANVLSAHGVMEEALTEESARILTLEWLRDQGMDDVLVAVKRKVTDFENTNPNGRYTDATLLGSYTNYRRRLQRLFDEADVPEGERRDMVMRMKFEMTPEERMTFLDDRLGHIETTAGQARTGYTPGRKIMGVDVVEPAKVGEEFTPASRRKSSLLRPVVPDLPELTDVTIPVQPHDAAQVGDTVSVNDLGTRRDGAIIAVDEPWAGWVKIRDADGNEHVTPRAGILAITDGPSGPVEPSQSRPTVAIDGPSGVRQIGVGDGVRVSSSDGSSEDGLVVEVPDDNPLTNYVKVRTPDGLELWMITDRLS